MRAALLLALVPTLVAGQDVTHLVWGVPVEGSMPSMLSLEPCNLPCVAVVRFDNTLVTQGLEHGSGSPAATQSSLSIAGVTIAIRIKNEIGFAPDLMQVLPPAGYAAEPREVLVDDNASGRVRVVLVPIS